MTPPKNGTEIRSFLWLYNVYRLFVPNFSWIAKALNKMLQKGKRTNFESLSDKATDAFQTLKSKLYNLPILSLPRSAVPYVHDTDAWNSHIVCVLMQAYPEKTKRPI